MTLGKLIMLAAGLSIPVLAQQASITLGNADVAYCYKQDASWSITKINDAVNQPVASGTTVNWSVKANRGPNGPTKLCAIGFISVTNTGTAPATIGNIVVDLQRNLGSNKWYAVAADVADATNGDAAVTDKVASAALANNATYSGVAAVAGSMATFTENSMISGPLEFTDANSNTMFSLVPQVSLAPGATINLYFSATFFADNLHPALVSGELLRTEVLVSFGNAGGRGGSGASAQNIDINGNGIIDPDEKNVRTVPARVTKALPALQICNDTVLITDTFTTTPNAAVSVSVDPIGAGVTTNTSATYVVTGMVSGDGTVSNTADLIGPGSTVTLTIDALGDTVQRQCCGPIDLSDTSSVQVDPPAPTSTYCSYRRQEFLHNGAGNSILQNNFTSSFPSGLVIGTTPNNYAKWTMESKFETWLGAGAGSNPGALSANTTNATSTAGGDLPKNVAALALNLGLPISPGIGNLIFSNPGDALDGLTVTQILGAANTAIGSGTPPNGYSFNSLNVLVDQLSQSWDKCHPNALVNQGKLHE